MGRGVGYRAEDRGTTPLCSWRDLASICSALSAYLTLGRRRCQLLLIFAECSSGARKPTRYTSCGAGKGCKEGCGETYLIPAPLVTVLLRANLTCGWHGSTPSLPKRRLASTPVRPWSGRLSPRQGGTRERSLCPSLHVWAGWDLPECSRKTLFHLLMRELRHRGLS